jgi:hypothetical protein
MLYHLSHIPNSRFACSRTIPKWNHKITFILNIHFRFILRKVFKEIITKAGFVNEETKTQRDSITCPKSHSGGAGAKTESSTSELILPPTNMVDKNEVSWKGANSSPFTCMRKVFLPPQLTICDLCLPYEKNTKNVHSTCNEISST